MARIQSITFASDGTYADSSSITLNAAGDTYLVGGVPIPPADLQPTCEAILELVDQPSDGITDLSKLVEATGHVVEMVEATREVRLAAGSSLYPEAKIRDFVTACQISGFYTPA